MKVLVCANAAFAALYGMETGRVIDVRNEGCALCEHEARHYDAIPLSDEVWREIEPYYNKGGHVIYDYKKGEVKWQKHIHLK